MKSPLASLIRSVRRWPSRLCIVFGRNDGDTADQVCSSGSVWIGEQLSNRCSVGLSACQDHRDRERPHVHFGPSRFLGLVREPAVRRERRRDCSVDPGTTKNREGRSFPFTTALEALLKEQYGEHECLKKGGRIVPLVFHRDGQRIRDLRAAWSTACTAAGCPGRLRHDFRRTAVRNLERAGVSRSAAMAMVGHKTEAIYRRYAIVDSGVLREAAGKIDRASLLTGTNPGTTTDHPQQPAAAHSA